METQQQDEPEVEINTQQTAQADLKIENEPILPTYLSEIEVPKNIEEAGLDDLLDYYFKLFRQAVFPKHRQSILMKSLQTAKSVHVRMKADLKPDEKTKHKELLFLCLRLIFLL